MAVRLREYLSSELVVEGAPCVFHIVPADRRHVALVGSILIAQYTFFDVLQYDACARLAALCFVR